MHINNFEGLFLVGILQNYAVNNYTFLSLPIVYKNINIIRNAKTADLRFNIKIFILFKISSYQYVSLRLRVQNAVSPQPCVGKFRISIELLAL